MKPIYFSLALALIFLCSYRPFDSQQKDKQAITQLIRDALDWAESQKDFDVLPGVENDKDSLYRSFDMQALKGNLARLRKTGYFSEKFLANYEKLILTLDKGLKSGKYKWYQGELPPFNFYNDVDPWCRCQETPEDSPWRAVTIKVIELDKQEGKLMWTWPKDANWSDSGYKFEVEKENGKWKISYMEGFDYEDGIKGE